MDSLAGQLLISGPGLQDPNFRHTVVLIGGHDEEGAFGVVLNRATEYRVADVFPPLIELVDTEAVVFGGGPVQVTQPVMLAQLTDPSLASFAVFANVGFLTGEVTSDVRPSIVRARVYAGYAGWGPGQLEEEIEGDAWILDPARVDDVFTDEPASLWRRVLQRKGPQYRLIALTPEDPRRN